jgi:hypothetical protein
MILQQDDESIPNNFYENEPVVHPTEQDENVSATQSILVIHGLLLQTKKLLRNFWKMALIRTLKLTLTKTLNYSKNFWSLWLRVSQYCGMYKTTI